MRRHGILLRVIGISLVAFLLLVLWPDVPRPPVLSVVTIERAGIVDDAGVEMRLVTLSICNPDERAPAPQRYLHVKDSRTPLEAKIANHWVPIEGTLGGCQFAPHASRERSIVLPAGAIACRVRLQYTGTGVSFKSTMASLVESLPSWIRFRLSYKFWRWVGFPRYEPSSHWREISLELPIPQPIETDFRP
jgi:hypothetical protein